MFPFFTCPDFISTIGFDIKYCNFIWEVCDCVKAVTIYIFFLSGYQFDDSTQYDLQFYQQCHLLLSSFDSVYDLQINEQMM